MLASYVGSVLPEDYLTILYHSTIQLWRTGPRHMRLSRASEPRGRAGLNPSGGLKRAPSARTFSGHGSEYQMLALPRDRHLGGGHKKNTHAGIFCARLMTLSQRVFFLVYFSCHTNELNYKVLTSHPTQLTHTLACVHTCCSFFHSHN